MKLFIAGSSQDRLWIQSLIDLLNRQGHEVFDWTRHPDWSRPDGPEDPEGVADADLKAVAEADGIIWLLTEKSSHGSPFEAGYAHGLGKPVIVFSPEDLEAHQIYGHIFQQAEDIVKALHLLSIDMGRYCIHTIKDDGSIGEEIAFFDRGLTNGQDKFLVTILRSSGGYMIEDQDSLEAALEAVKKECRENGDLQTPYTLWVETPHLGAYTA